MDKLIIKDIMEESQLNSDDCQYDFEDELSDIAERFGCENQEGIKFALNRAQDIFGCVDVNRRTMIAKAFGVEDKMVKTLIRFTPSIKEEIVDCEIVCCSGPRCAKNGSMEVLKTFRDEFGMDFNETTPDRKIRLTLKNCFKHCGKGPNVCVNGKFYHQMDRQKSLSLIKELKEKYGYRKK